ncbi:ATP-binding protein [Caballeronia sp. LZ043]|uniref:PAS domain-containing sensor histidine kinase n=1 Tax=Caballeronia sp. LZ043 TaxID=3038569 RepID=UPI0028554322|nr:ATP-binding protein [Caballeronia sp. LZ043]MDR5822524.1 ATP-binding protein [Caballeronia sp. LZ043]
MDDPLRTSFPHEPNGSALFEALCDAYVVVDDDLRIVFANHRFLALSGLTRHAVMGKSIVDFNPHDTDDQRKARHAWLAAVCAKLLPGTSAESPYLPGNFQLDPSKSPETRVWEFGASVVAPADSTQSYIALRVIDATDRVEREDADKREKARLRSQAQLRRIIAEEKERQLAESRARFAEALAFANVGAWQRDLLTGVVTCTNECKSNFGLDLDDELSEARLFEQLIDPLDRAWVRTELDAAIGNHQDYRVEYRIVWPDRSQHWVMVGGRALYNEAGRPTQMLGFVLDITARKQQELDHRQIAGDERLAREQSDRNALAMDHFMAAVSHELRSPVGVILNWTELLQRPGFKSHLPQAAATIQRNARQLALMVDDLLDSGAIVSGKLSFSFAAVELAELIADLVSDLRLQAEHKGWRFITSRMDRCVVQGDAARIKQIVWNLINNAIKFTEAGVIDVSVSAEGDKAVLCVQDSGRGIAADTIDKVFERFEQIKPSASGRVGGLGLGLWLVKTLAERHNGSVEARSEGDGMGAAFFVSLPLTD